MDLSWTTDHRDGVTLVACRLRNPEPIARRARVENELDGPVLPPRSHGEPLPGWDDDGVTLRIEPETSAAVGYAVPAPAAEPPASVAFDEPAREAAADATRVTERVPGTASGTDPTAADPNAADAVRTLGAYRPPRGAITEPGRDQSEPDTSTAAPDGDSIDAGDGNDAEGEQPNEVPSSTTLSPSDQPTPSASDPPTASPADPAAVDAWLDAVERRVARAERLDGADVPTATEAVATVGGLDAVHDLDEKVDDDAARLRTVAERAAALADRAAEAEVPTGPLGRLA